MASPNVVSRFLLLLALAWFNVAWGASAAVVTHISGTLSVLKVDGTSRILSQSSEVESGDTLTTQKDSFARLKFSDGGELTLRPNSVFKVEDYAFEESQPQKDSFLSNLLKGGLRTITGLVSKRGNRDVYRMNTATATIGIRGTYYAVLTCKDDCKAGMKNGTYTKVLEGVISLKNAFGEIECSTGETCFSGDDGPPIVLSDDPGVDFDPPPLFGDEITGDTVVDSQGHKECKFD